MYAMTSLIGRAFFWKGASEISFQRDSQLLATINLVLQEAFQLLDPVRQSYIGSRDLPAIIALNHEGFSGQTFFLNLTSAIAVAAILNNCFAFLHVVGFAFGMCGRDGNAGDGFSC